MLCDLPYFGNLLHILQRHTILNWRFIKRSRCHNLKRIFEFLLIKMVRYAALTGFYELEKTIGCGGFAKVKLATHIATGEKVAIKIMDKAALNVDLHRVKLELKALKNLSHPHICKLYQVIETETHYFIVIEYCSGGELFDHIVEKNKLTETESRMFFRQIISAVAYLHSLGYAHRDLKPENILLDKDLNLKLIDFGLCAKPEGGIQNFLVTSCGSPTYAAPELVLGKQYLGPEVDVWAMGVLLYVLLSGFLPFDDENIDNLYKKILRGNYKEPPFMSQGSKDIIKRMLQVDPKKRITVNELLSHHWFTLGILNPIAFQPDPNKSYDNDCVSLMATYHGVTPDRMWKHLKRWRYDYETATYFLLLLKKKKRAPMKLNPGAVKLPIRVKMADPVKKLNRHKDEHADLTRFIRPVVIRTVRSPDRKGAMKLNYEETPRVLRQREILNLGEVQAWKSTSVRKGQKRYRSPNTDVEDSPVPAKKITTANASLRTPERKRQQLCVDTSGSARKVLGSIERSLNRVRNVLTPKKPTADVPQHPVMLTNKDLQNVSTTQSTDPEFVMNELYKALKTKGIHCDRKGFTLRGKMDPSVERRLGGCSFELEICYLPCLDPTKSKQTLKRPTTKSIIKNGILSKVASARLKSVVSESNDTTKVGIRRKRLKGDSWCYKKVCEEVLALTATELKQPMESNV